MKNFSGSVYIYPTCVYTECTLYLRQETINWFYSKVARRRRGRVFDDRWNGAFVTFIVYGASKFVLVPYLDIEDIKS